MTGIGKPLYFKIIAICLSVCLFVDTAGYAAPTLRANLMFDQGKRGQGVQRINAAENSVATESAKKQEIARVLQSLKPDFGIRRELTPAQFVRHLGRLGIDTDIARLGLGAGKSLYGFDILKGGMPRLIKDIATVTMIGIYIAYLALTGQMPDDLSSLTVQIAIIAYICSLPAFALTLERPRVSPALNIGLLILIGVTILGIAFDLPMGILVLAGVIHMMPVIVDLIPGIPEPAATKKLKDLYAYLLLERLIARGIIDLSIKDASSKLGLDNGFSVDSRGITPEALKEIERKVLKLSEHTYVTSVSEGEELPIVQESHEGPRLASGEGLSGFSTERLMIEAELAMPRWDEKWGRFLDILVELKKREGVRVKILGNRVQRREKPIEGESYHDVKELYYGEFLEEHVGREAKFLRDTHMNFEQHVPSGAAFAVRQEVTTEKGSAYTMISVIDNGEGPIGKDGNPLSVRKILDNFGQSLGKGIGGSSGRGFSYAVRLNSDLTVVHIPGQTTIVSGEGIDQIGDLERPPKIIDEMPNRTKTRGVTVIGYFLHEGADRRDVEEDVVRRTKKDIELRSLLALKQGMGGFLSRLLFSPREALNFI